MASTPTPNEQRFWASAAVLGIIVLGAVIAVPIALIWLLLRRSARAAAVLAFVIAFPVAAIGMYELLWTWEVSRLR